MAANKNPPISGQNIISYSAATPTFDLRDCLNEKEPDLPILVRNFGKRELGIEKNADVVRIDKFLDHQESLGLPAPSCQIPGESRNRNLSYTELRASFQTHPDDRENVVNVLDIPISDQLDLVQGIEVPRVALQSLLEYTKSPAKTARVLRGGVKSSHEDQFVLLSQFSSFSGVHMDAKGLGTYVCVSTGMKLWFVVPSSTNNLEARKKYGEFESIKHYTEVTCVLLRPGDLFLMKPGTLHAVYTPCDSKVIGGHFLHPRFLMESLKMAQMSQETKHLTNDPVEKKVVQEQFSNLIQVSPRLLTFR